MIAAMVFPDGDLAVGQQIKNIFSIREPGYWMIEVKTFSLKLSKNENVTILQWENQLLKVCLCLWDHL